MPKLIRLKITSCKDYDMDTKCPYCSPEWGPKEGETSYVCNKVVLPNAYKKLGKER